MTPPRFTISQQRQAVEGLLAFAKVGSETELAARQAALTLAWIERRSELVKEVERLDREAPELLSVLKEFPGAKIVGAK